MVNHGASGKLEDVGGKLPTSVYEQEGEIKVNTTYWREAKKRTRKAINSFTASACKLSGRKDSGTRLQTTHFPVL